MNKIDKIMFRIGIAGIMVTAFCLGWNSDHFSFKSDK